MTSEAEPEAENDDTDDNNDDDDNHRTSLQIGRGRAAGCWNRQSWSAGSLDSSFNPHDSSIDLWMQRVRDWWHGLSSIERAVLAYWTGNGYTGLQYIARARETDVQLSAREVDPVIRRFVMHAPVVLQSLFPNHGGASLRQAITQLSALERVMHDALRRAPAYPLPTILWRGLDLKPIAIDRIACDRRVLQTRSAQSWSRSPQVASNFGTTLVLALLVPAHTILADVWAAHITNVNSSEMEIIIPRGTYVQVVDARLPRQSATVKFTLCTEEGSCESHATELQNEAVIIFRLLTPSAAAALVRLEENNALQTIHDYSQPARSGSQKVHPPRRRSTRPRGVSA